MGFERMCCKHIDNKVFYVCYKTLGFYYFSKLIKKGEKSIEENEIRIAVLYKPCPDRFN